MIIMIHRIKIIISKQYTVILKQYTAIIKQYTVILKKSVQNIQNISKLASYTSGSQCYLS